MVSNTEGLVRSRALVNRLTSSFRADVKLWLSGVLLALIVLGAIFAPLLSPADPYHQDLLARNIPPFWHERGSLSHPLGTDPLGRDYLSRLIYGARISLVIGRQGSAVG